MPGKLKGGDGKKKTNPNKQTKKYSGCKMGGVNRNHSISYLRWLDLSHSRQADTLKTHKYIDGESPGLDFPSEKKIISDLETGFGSLSNVLLG